MKRIINILNSKMKLLIGIVSGLVVGGVATVAVMAATPDSSGVIHSCYKNSNGALRIIDNATQSCGNNETALGWNQAGSSSDTTLFTGRVGDISYGEGRFIIGARSSNYNGNSSTSLSPPYPIKVNQFNSKLYRQLQDGTGGEVVEAPGSGNSREFTLIVDGQHFPLCNIVDTNTSCQTSTANIDVPPNSEIALGFDYSGQFPEDGPVPVWDFLYSITFEK